jgi:hypothetical protein
MAPARSSQPFIALGLYFQWRPVWSNAFLHGSLWLNQTHAANRLFFFLLFTG